jgi:hypothetical protein
MRGDEICLILIEFLLNWNLKELSILYALISECDFQNEGA